MSATRSSSGQNRWNVVGVFETDGGVAETEVWIDARTLQGAYRRGNSYQSVLAQLDSPDSFDAFRDWLTANPQLNVAVRRENEYYVMQSQMLTRPDSDYRLRHCRAHGHRRGVRRDSHDVHRGCHARRARSPRCVRSDSTPGSVLVSILAESLVLGAIGGIIGGAVAYLGFQRIPDLDHELSDLQPGGVRLSRDTATARHGPVLRAGDGAGRRLVPGYPRGEAANPDGPARARKHEVCAGIDRYYSGDGTRRADLL